MVIICNQQRAFSIKNRVREKGGRSDGGIERSVAYQRHEENKGGEEREGDRHRDEFAELDEEENRATHAWVRGSEQAQEQ